MDTMPILNNWIEIRSSHGSVVIGEIYQDSRFKAGQTINTSLVVDLSREFGTLKTKNSTYDLGKEIVT